MRKANNKVHFRYIKKLLPEGRNMINEQDVYYGMALSQIAQYPVSTTINKICDREGLFNISDNRYLLIKYSTSVLPRWNFKLTSDDIKTINLQVEDTNFYFNQDDKESFINDDPKNQLFLILVCGQETICCLDRNDLLELIDLEGRLDKKQSIIVTYENTDQLILTGTMGSLLKPITDSFPKYIYHDCRWPHLSTINIYWDMELTLPLVDSIKDRWFDLAASIEAPDDRPYFPSEGDTKTETVYFEVSVEDPGWETWDESNLTKIEAGIQEDLDWEGDTAIIERITQDKNLACKNKFLWRLKITVNNLMDFDDYEFEEEANNSLSQ